MSPKKLKALSCLFACLAVPASAAAGCDSVSAQGRAANPANYDPPRHYDMEELAKARAIAAWRVIAARECAVSRAAWSKATGRSVDCEGYAGGLECTARATPAL